MSEYAGGSVVDGAWEDYCLQSEGRYSVPVWREIERAFRAGAAAAMRPQAAAMVITINTVDESPAQVAEKVAAEIKRRLRWAL